MKISLLCNDPEHPINAHLEKWIKQNCKQHEIALFRRKRDLPGGDILFLVSCSEIIQASEREKYKACLVLHASDLPQGRGWSPHVWEIIGGAEQITVSLLEAENKVDSGRIWKKIKLSIPKHALWNEINELLFQAEIDLMNFAIEGFDQVEPQEQSTEIEPTYYRRRTPGDSMINPFISIKEQFDQIRVCDPLRFPAFFELHGQRFKLILEKVNVQSDYD